MSRMNARFPRKRGVSFATLRAALLAALATLAMTGSLAAQEAAEGAATADEQAAPENTPGEASDAEASGQPAVPVPPEIEKILSNQSTDVESVDCIRAHRIRNTQILSNQHVAFRTGREEWYLVTFRNKCIGLRPRSKISIERRSQMSLCRMDTIRPLEEWGFGEYREGAFCHITEFQPITKEQLELMKQHLAR